MIGEESRFVALLSRPDRSTTRCLQCGRRIDRQNDSYTLVADRSTERWTWYVVCLGGRCL